MTLLRDIAKDILRLGVALLFLGAVVATAWTGPTASPPNNNTAAPLNIGSTAQTKAGELTATKFTSSGGFVSQSSTGLRMAFGTYGSMWYNDGGTTYFLLTNAGDPYGSWNSLRPLYINNASGAVVVGTQLCLAGVCKTAWPSSGYSFGGFYSSWWSNVYGSRCGGNYYVGGGSASDIGLTGACGCPSWAPYATAVTPTNQSYGIVALTGGQAYGGVYACYS